MLIESICFLNRGNNRDSKLPAHRAGLPGNEGMIIRSASLPAPAYRQEGGALPADCPEPENIDLVGVNADATLFLSIWPQKNRPFRYLEGTF